MTESNLEPNKVDLITSVAKSLLGAVPVAGNALSELIGQLIPNQRIDRLTKYILALENKLSNISAEKLKEIWKDENCLNLFEEGFIQASLTTSEERRIQIASVVKNGIDNDSISYSESKYLLKLLNELNDQEIIWLRYHLNPAIGSDAEFYEKHKNILEPIHAYYGADDTLLEKAALQDSYKEHLERLGLVQPKYRLNRDTKMPEFDRFSGKPSVSYVCISRLGRLVLKQIDMLDSE